MWSFPYFLGNQQGHLSPLSLNLLLKAFLSSPSPLFIVWPHRDCWNVDHRGQLRKSLNLESQRLLGGHACHFPEKHFVYQILIRLECPSSWEVDELWLLFKKNQVCQSTGEAHRLGQSCHIKGRRLTSLGPESPRASPAHLHRGAAITTFQPQNASLSQTVTVPTKHLPIFPPSCPWQPLLCFLAL